VGQWHRSWENSSAGVENAWRLAAVGSLLLAANKSFLGLRERGGLDQWGGDVHKKGSDM
jgi:hypothetical protein